MTTPLNKPVLNIHDIQGTPFSPEFGPSGSAAHHFAVSTARISQALGAQKLGYNVSTVPPGKAAYPFHSHRVNEEMFLILSGTAELRLGSATYPLREGDVIACPPGGPETAHQIRNSGTTDLRFLAVSTRLSPEICDYPDSRKFGVYAELPPARDGTPAYFAHMARDELSLDYWDGEGGNPG
jgi:uncharacterized cupin superfamily protein